MLEQAALADFLREGHLKRHIRRMRRLYKRRRETLEAVAKTIERRRRAVRRSGATSTR